MAGTDLVIAPERPEGKLPLGVPFLRTFASTRFRVTLALVLCLAGATVLGAVLVRQMGDPKGQFAFDFNVYFAAAERFAATGTPYGQQMFDGPVPAQGVYEGIYKYAPPFAQLLTPFLFMGSTVAAAVWFVAQAAMILVGTFFAARQGGAPRSLETLLWCAVAATFFLPNFDTLWKGNVSGALAFFVAFSLAGGSGRGAATAAAIVIKTTPVTLLPAALVAGRSVWRGLLLGAGFVAVSVLLAPRAWVDFIRILPNLISGSAAFPTNIAPDNIVLYTFPDYPFAATIVRIGAIVAGVGCVALSVMAARRERGWPLAVFLGVAAMLLLASSNWYHYLAVLLPLGAFAWPGATRAQRLLILGGSSTITFALVWLPLAVVGAVALVAGAVGAAWPARIRPQQSSIRANREIGEGNA